MRGDAAVPVLEMLRTTNDDLRIRAERIIAALDGLPLARRAIGAGRAQIGGGTLPRSVMPSVTLDLTHRTLKPQEMAARLRDSTIPVIGYVARGTLKLDLRTIFPRQDQDVVERHPRRSARRDRVRNVRHASISSSPPPVTSITARARSSRR